MKYIKKVLGSLRKADNDYKLIENGNIYINNNMDFSFIWVI